MLREFGKSVLWYGLASAVSKFIGIFLIPIFSRYYSPDQFGSVDLIATFVSFVAILGMMQLESAISRFYFEGDGEGRNEYISTAFWSIAGLSILFVALTVILSSRISQLFFDTTEHARIISIASINIVLLNVLGFLLVLLRFSNRPNVYTAVVFLQFVTTFISSLVFIALDLGLVAFFAGQICGLVAGCIGLLFFYRNTLVLKFRREKLRMFLHYSLPQVPAVGVNWLNSYANRFIMLEYLTMAEIGIYTVGLKIATVFFLVDSAFKMVWEPFIWEKLKRDDHKALLSRIATQVSIVIFLVASLGMLYAEELVLILSTRDYMSAAPIIRILFFAFAFPILVNVFGIGTSIAKRTIFNTVSFSCGLMVNISLAWVIVPIIGLNGVPLSLAVGNIVIFALMGYFAERLYPVGYNYGLFLLLCAVFITIGVLIFVVKLHLVVKILISIAGLVAILLRGKQFLSLVDNR